MAQQVTKEEAYIIGAAQKRFKEEYRKKKKKAKIRSNILWTLFFIVMTFIVFNTGFLVYEYRGSGMSSVCEEGDIVITNRLSFLVNKPERGEVVTIKNGTTYDLKRVIGLPGDQIDFENGDVYINGTRCIEPYVQGITEANVSHFLVSEGSYYILNDDRDDTGDSREKEYTDSTIQGSEIAVIHIPSIIRNNQAYQAVRVFCKSGARIMGNIENTILGFLD